MSVSDQILDLLEGADAPLSGEEMAAKLGVTRNTVWKAVNRLKEAGYEIEAATNRGYRLVSERNALTPQGVRRLLAGPAERCAIQVQESVTSTNTVLKGLAEQGGAEGMVLLAQEQTQGKGRLGRTFFSPKGTGLYMSVLLRPRFSAEEDDLFAALKEARIVIADPLYRMAVRGNDTVQFIDLPHEGCSGRIYRKDIPILIGACANDWLEKRFCI